MKRKIFSIWSVLLILVASIAVLVPGCDGTAQCTIEVDATFDGAPWSGAVDYTLAGPGAAAPTIINGTSVSTTHTVDCGNWTCAYVSGGPGVFVNITPSPNQTVSAGGTITFTLNFVTIPPLDASIVFDTWTINGIPVTPGTYPIGPNTIIDVEYKEHVDGEPGEVYTVHQTSWLWFHYLGPDEGIWLHCVNHPDAVKMDPDATKLYQYCTVWGEPVEHCDEIWVKACVPILLDVEIGWELEVCKDYTKTINWLGFPSPPDILFDVGASPGASFNLTSSACIELEGDTNHDNDCTGNSTPLIILY